MTIFSGPTKVPWDDRVPSSYGANATPDPTQGAARISADIAVIAYGEIVPIGSGAPYSHSVPHLRAVRFTEEGPELGPPAVHPVTGKVHILVGVRAGGDGEAWILTVVTNGTGASDYWRIGRVTVNPTTLAVSVEWRLEIPGRANTALVMDLWVAQRTMVIATEYDPTNGRSQRSLILVNIDSGALVHTALPLNGYSSIRAREIAIHPDRQEVLLVADHRPNGSADRPTIWLVPVTPTSIGTFVRYLPPGYPTPYSSNIYSEVWRAQPRPGSRWMLAGLYSTNDEYNSPVNDYWGSSRLRHYTISGTSTISEHLGALSILAKGAYNGTRSSSVDLAMNGARPVAAVAEFTDRTIAAPGTGVGGVRHVELTDGDNGQILDVLYLPGTANIVERDGTVNVVALGDNRYIYLVGGQGVDGSVVTQRQSGFEFWVYAAGPVMSEPVIILPGIKGTSPEENRRTFRRVVG